MIPIENGLKIFPRLLLLFIIAICYEYLYLKTHIDHSRIYFHIIDLGFTDVSATFLQLEVVYFMLLLLMFWEFFLIPCGIIAAIVCLSLINLDMAGRYQFEFLAPFILFSFSLTSVIKKTKLDLSWTAVPLMALVVSVYGFSSFHKLYTFQNMLSFLPEQLVRISNGALASVCADKSCFLFTFMAWVVVPVEAIMAILTARKEWLRPRIILVVLFHWGVAVASHLWQVSILMLALHFYIACLQEPETAKQVLRNRKWPLFVCLELFFFLGHNYFFARTASSWWQLIQKICETNLRLFPIIFLLIPFLRSAPLNASIPFKNLPVFLKTLFLPRKLVQAAISIYFLLLIAFGFSPFITENNYAITALGWTPASGGHEYTQIYLLTVPNRSCYFEKLPSVVINTKTFDDKIIYAGTRMIDMQRLKQMFEKECYLHDGSDPKLAILNGPEGMGYQLTNLHIDER